MYGKFFASTYTGSMFGAGPDVFAVWGYVIANTGQDSTVELNPSLLAAVLGTTPERVAAAIATLCDPDPASRSPAREGRRLVHEGAFAYSVTTHAAYRAIRNDEERRAYNREKQRESRARRAAVKQDVNDVSRRVPPSAHTEAEAEAEAEEEEHRHAEDGVTSAVSAATSGSAETPESAGTEETAGTHADATQKAAARSGSADGPAPQATTANAASATTAPGNGAPTLPGIDPGPGRGAAAKRREAAASEQRVFAAWQEAMGRPDAVLDAPRRRRIAWAVREYGEARAVAAIRGCAATPWNMGENEQRKRWDDLTLIFRDATHVERFLATDTVHGGQKSAREKAAAVARELRESGDAAE